MRGEIRRTFQNVFKRDDAERHDSGVDGLQEL